jgi:hypothetical protein
VAGAGRLAGAAIDLNPPLPSSLIMHERIDPSQGFDRLSPNGWMIQPSTQRQAENLPWTLHQPFAPSLSKGALPNRSP